MRRWEWPRTFDIRTPLTKGRGGRRRRARTRRGTRWCRQPGGISRWSTSPRPRRPESTSFFIVRLDALRCQHCASTLTLCWDVGGRLHEVQRVLGGGATRLGDAVAGRESDHVAARSGDVAVLSPVAQALHCTGVPLSSALSRPLPILAPPHERSRVVLAAGALN